MPKQVQARAAQNEEEERQVRKLARSHHAPADWKFHAQMVLEGSVRTQREACPGDRLRGMMRTIPYRRRSASCIAHTAPQSRPKKTPRRPRSALGHSEASLVSTSSTSVQETRSTSCNIPPMWSFWLSCGGSGTR